MAETIHLKTPAEIAKMREAGRVVAQALALMGRLIAPGVTTKALDTAVEELIIKAGGTPTFKNSPAPRRVFSRFPRPFAHR